jgi:phospholipase C
MSRREFMAKASAAGGAAVVASWASPIIERAFAADPAGTGSLNDIEHFVFLMQENRSFDHYFGTLSGVRGFDDPTGSWAQYGYDPKTHKASDSGYVLPFRLNTKQGPTIDGDCINDPTHDWGPQHQCWNGGAMDQWIKVHLANDGVRNGPAIMGYYERADIPVHYALADAFTVCDHYHCSVLGPTDPNRLYWMSATIDPDGNNGGPLLDTPLSIPKNKYSWMTYPEALQEAGVSWKVYANKDFALISSVALDGMLQCFKNFQDPNSDLYKRGRKPTYPNDFRTDVKNGTLPKVSWIIPNLLDCEHPALPPALGAQGIVQVLDILTSNPAVWEKTALIISYDENGGFFDHVTPPTAPPGTPGEYVTVPLAGVTDSAGIAGPIGLGFRVPGLVLSPYSRGGLVASETFDHTSQLRLIETRFGVEVPNLTAWRRSVTGDMTSAFNFAAAPSSGAPKLPASGPLVLSSLLECKAGVDALLGTFLAEDALSSYPVPPNSMPKQETTPVRGTPSGPVGAATATASARTVGAGSVVVAEPAVERRAVEPTQGKPRTKVARAADAIRAQQLAKQAVGGNGERDALLAGAAVVGAAGVVAAARKRAAGAAQAEALSAGPAQSVASADVVDPDA